MARVRQVRLEVTLRQGLALLLQDAVQSLGFGPHLLEHLDRQLEDDRVRLAYQVVLDLGLELAAILLVVLDAAIEPVAALFRSKTGTN